MIETETVDAEQEIVEMAHLIVYREWGFEGLLFLATKPKVWLNDKHIGTCSYRDRIDMDIAAGTYVLNSESEPDNSRIFAVEPGETAFVRCKLTSGIFLPNMDLQFMEEQEAVSDIAEIAAGE